MKSLMKPIKCDLFFLYSFISLFFKTILFIIVLPSQSASKIDPLHAYTSIPPFLIYISFITIFISFAFLFKSRIRLLYLILINLFISLTLICDLLYYRGYSDLLSPYLLKQGSNIEDLGSTIVSMLRFIDIFFILDLLIVIPYALKNKNIYHDTSRNLLVFTFLIILSIAYIGYDHYRIDVLHKGVTRKMLFRRSWSLVQTVSNLGPIGYHLYSTYSFLKDAKPYSLNKDEVLRIRKWFDQKQEPLPDNKYKGMFSDKNLLILQVESLENFIISESIGNQEITPNLNRLLKNSIYFTNYKEQVYNGTSSDADLMTNTSIYPVRKGSTFIRFPYNTYNSFPKLLKEKGYYTTAIHPEKGSYWNWMAALKSMGFDRCIDSTSFELDEKINLGLSDGSYLRQVEPIIKKQKKPFYTFMVTLTSHSPFKLPKKYKTLHLDDNLKNTRLGAYFQCLHYTDNQIGSFISKLDRDGLLEDTVIIIYGDHGGVHKFYQDEIDKIASLEPRYADNHRNIPLIIYSKGMLPEKKFILGGQVDLMPTLCYLMGIEDNKYAKTTMGRNLLNTNRNFVLLSNKTYIGDDKSYKRDVIEGIRISDELIRSNYFKSFMKH